MEEHEILRLLELGLGTHIYKELDNDEEETDDGQLNKLNFQDYYSHHFYKRHNI